MELLARILSNVPHGRTIQNADNFLGQCFFFAGKGLLDERIRARLYERILNLICGEATYYGADTVGSHGVCGFCPKELLLNASHLCLFFGVEFSETNEIAKQTGLN